MALDLTQTAGQLHAATPGLRAQTEHGAARLQAAEQALTEADPADIATRTAAGTLTWLVAGIEDSLTETVPEPPLPASHAVVAVDGSHIDVDRHSPVRCFLINIGKVSLRYGEEPDAELSSTPHLVTDDASLSLRGTAGVREVPIEGPLLGMLRAVMELEALADLVDETPIDLPVLALLDGSLILWGLTGGAYPDFVRAKLLDQRLLPALDRLREAGKTRPVAVASHVSLPRSTDVVNALRVWKGVCAWEHVNCDANCGLLDRGQRSCDSVDGVTDAALYGSTLAHGERSPLFRTTSSVVTDHYADHQVRFFYAHLGEEIARVELPAWVDGAALDLTHAGLLAQARKGHGYPVALQEAHEQAVVNTSDRQMFAQLLEETLEGEHLPTSTSQKARSKRTRWV